MPIKHIRIENFKSIKRCDIDFNDLTVLIGANGSGKTNILDSLNYFFNNLTERNISNNIFDANNKFSNQVKITVTFDLTNFVIISKTHTNELFNFLDYNSYQSKYNNYYKSIIALASSKKDNTLSLQLSQVKGKEIQWSEPYEKRYIIKSLFPLFYISARDLDLKKWSHIWSVLGELGKVSNSERKIIEKQIQDIIENDIETSNKIKAICSIFEQSELSVKSATAKEYATILTKIYFSGEIINQKGRHLNYFSTGTSSVKYIELLLRAINEIVKNKMKEPLVLFDEPEINLHPNFVDELSDALLLVDNKLKIVISTHSARLTKNLMTSSKDIFLYNVKINNCYTELKLMKKFIQYSPSSQYRVTDDHINSYFSKGILFVEGETELELFSNPYLRALFPQLKIIDIFQAMTQAPILNIMNPQKAKTGIPYICLIDADKAIGFENQPIKITLQGEYFHETKEKYLYKNKKSKSSFLRHQRQRIEGMADKLRLHYYEPYYSCNDQFYNEFINTVHKYLLNYCVYMFKTTIEGALINEHSYTYAMKFLKEHNNESDFTDFENCINSYYKTDRLNILRLMYKGKTDLLIKYSTIKRLIDQNTGLTYDKVRIGKKTSGWVSKYIDTFFLNILPSHVEKTPRGMKRYIEENAEFKKEVLNEFKYNFPELYNLFLKINYIIS